MYFTNADIKTVVDSLTLNQNCVSTLKKQTGREENKDLKTDNSV